MPENEIDKFFGDLPSEDKKLADIFDEGSKETDSEKGTGGGTSEEEGDAPKNRRERRENKQLQWEREQRIRLEAQLEERTRADALRTTDPTLDERLIRMYGPDNIEAAKLHGALLNDYAKQAEDRALERFQAMSKAQQEEENRYREVIESQIEDIEEEYDVDLSSGSAKANRQRREFLELVQKLSPKDANGVVTDYADFGGVWEEYQVRADKPADASRAKEIAARSMQKSGTGTQTQTRQLTPGFDGWKTDLGLQ